MEKHIQNVYCIGRNYKLHALELGNEVPSEPMVFMKPSHAVTILSPARSIPLPLHKGEVHHELEIVLRIGHKAEVGMTADEVVDSFALGIDFTLRDVQDVLKKKGHPWLPAKGVLHSGPVTSFHSYPGTESLKPSIFRLLRNGSVVQAGSAQDMIFSFDQIIAYIVEHYGLDEGDIIFTGTPAGVGPVQAGDQLELQWNSETWGTCQIEALGANLLR